MIHSSIFFFTFFLNLPLDIYIYIVQWGIERYLINLNKSDCTMEENKKRTCTMKSLGEKATYTD